MIFFSIVLINKKNNVYKIYIYTRLDNENIYLEEIIN